MCETLNDDDDVLICLCEGKFYREREKSLEENFTKYEKKSKPKTYIQKFHFREKRELDSLSCNAYN